VFFWPAAQALLRSFQVQDAFGTSTEWVGWPFPDAAGRRELRGVVQTTALFSALVAGAGHCLVAGAGGVCRPHQGALAKTLLVVPYAVAPAVAGVLGLHVSPRMGVVYAPARWASTGTTCSGRHVALIVMAAVWKQISYNFLFFFRALHVDSH
jgi:sn-glycerol 3-phosphate transport system permease protein